MKMAVWLYLFLFVAFFDLHAQYPMLTPFAVSLGAAPSFIGLVMGMYSLTHLPGNLLAGYGVDRFGSRLFIAASLSGAGVLLLLQSQVTDPWHLLYIRSASGFVLAFLSPACLSLLAKLARDHIQQGRLMAGNGLVHTIASVVSPAAGAWLAAKIGFAQSFSILGWILLATGIASLLFIREPKVVPLSGEPAPSAKRQDPAVPIASSKPVAEQNSHFPWVVFLLPIATSCAQGILSFELPLRAESSADVLTTGILFSIVSLGALSTLGLLFLQRYLPYARNIAGLLLMALAYYGLASDWPVPMAALLFVVGMSKGVVFPAMTSFMLQLSGTSRYGRTFSFMSIALSVGSFLGPVLAGLVREHMSPFFISFFVIMLSLIVLMPRPQYSIGWNGKAEPPPHAGH
ncbi:MFS transporter [Cohnella thailandensis]|uniref:MFS transporter n=1 Tax=Cohnella thailandensis TaxID=557557 RepID=A0A841SRD7_9BACL|nr:MFS transporter [Cohnella thailandensis]MBB6632728.1 MFS transporter [Cohnella thailandensis]MBP1975583.1 MFS family permease [Cohnella thailandensis]